MNTSTEKSLPPEVSILATELLVDKFYALRKAFEAVYSGKLRCDKYEDSRAFTIALNRAIFQANQLLLSEDRALSNTQNLETQLKRLKKCFLHLMN